MNWRTCLSLRGEAHAQHLARTVGMTAVMQEMQRAVARFADVVVGVAIGPEIGPDATFSYRDRTR
jgi:uncharacterized protein (DUF1501 family)